MGKIIVGEKTEWLEKNKQNKLKDQLQSWLDLAKETVGEVERMSEEFSQMSEELAQRD